MKTSKITQTISLDRTKSSSTVEPVQDEKTHTQKIVDENFSRVEKKFNKIATGAIGVSVASLLLGSLKYGLTFPAKVLKGLGDIFGSAATLASPIFLIGNEIINYKTRQSENNEKQGIRKIKETFDALSEGFYRCCSLGFTPFIFEPFINPEKIGESIFHKIATGLNLFPLALTGYMWGVGNFKALLAWCLRAKEQYFAYGAKTDEKLTEHNAKVESYGQIYNSYKREAILGSIMNPILQGLRQFADSLAFLKGEMSAREFFKRPFLGFSRLVSLFAGVPEFFAKGIDGVLRVVKEREHLKHVLPKFLDKPLDYLGKVYKEKIAVEKNTFLKSICYYAEVIFHTLSPLSMFALFAPLLDEPHLDEDAQSQGGLQGFIDRIVGRFGKGATIVFTGLYTFFSRLPQSVFQCTYFGRKIIGWLKSEPEEEKNKATNKLRDKICNQPAIKRISEFAKNGIKYLIPDFYEDIENEQGYLSYEQIQANYAYEQAKNSEEYKNLVSLGKQYQAVRKDGNPNRKQELETNINNLVDIIVQQYCVPFIREDALRSYYKLTDIEESNIKEKVTIKIKQKIGLLQESVRQPLPFPGAEFLGTYVFKLLDFVTRIMKTDYRSSHHNMTTVYDNDEIRISFYYELLPVLCKCIHGLRNTLNRIFNLFRFLGFSS